MTSSRSPTALEPVVGQGDVAERQSRSCPSLTCPGTKFIGGEPMNPATNMFTGVS